MGPRVCLLKIDLLGLYGTLLYIKWESVIPCITMWLPRSEIECGVCDDKASELSESPGREVDILTRSSVEQSRNHIRRKAILESAEIIYAA